MTRWISLLRGINVGGANLIRMPALKLFYESLGLSDVQTYLQSGNVIFTSPATDIPALEERIEQGIAQTFGLNIPVLIRTAADLQRLVDRNPFTHGRSEDRARLAVAFLQRPPDEAGLRRLSEFTDPLDEFFVSGQEIFLFCPNGFGRSKLTNTFFEKKLAVLATARNWNTVNALLKLAKNMD